MVRAGIGQGLLLGAFAILALALASLPAQAAGDTLLITGQLTYLPRIALTPDSLAIVELRDSASADAPVVAERRMALQGRQVPLPFELGVDRATLVPGVRYAVRGGILAAGRPSWATEPLVVDTAAETIELGELVMTPVRARGFASTLRCGDLTITVGFQGDLLRLEAGAEAIDLKQVESASGARFSAGTEPPTTFWSKGERATLVLHGVTYPECVVQRAEAPAFRARGNEPGWSLVIDAAGLVLTTGYGEARLAVGAPVPPPADGGVVLGVRPDGFAVGDPESAPIHGRIVLNEYLGRESYLHLDLEDGGDAVVEVSPDARHRAGETIGLSVKPGAAHLFAAADERRLAA